MYRTDLALEAKAQLERAGGSSDGILSSRRIKGGFRVTTVSVVNDEGAESIGKPKGKYITIELDRLIRRDDGAFSQCAAVLCDEISSLMTLQKGRAALVVGLGNRRITSDSIGPLAVRHTLATRHLVKTLPELFGDLRPVAAIEPGVLGVTGVESAELVRGVVAAVKPGAVICVDALASLSVDRLCRTVQLTDTGISPGSGVGNDRDPLDIHTLGVPVIAIGVPTVVGLPTDASERMIVTPRDIDDQAAAISKLIGYGIDMALNPTLSCDDVTMLLE